MKSSRTMEAAEGRPRRSSRGGTSVGWVALASGTLAVVVTMAPAEVAFSGAPAEPPPATTSGVAAPPVRSDRETGESPAASELLQGPALTVPREVIDMLDQRRRHLDRREAALLGAEERLLILKAELEALLSKYEKLAEAQQANGAFGARRDGEQQRRREKEIDERRHQFQPQLAKIYESMPAEEAAARLEHMPERKAIEVLRLLKGKSAGAILAAVRPERAARLTEQLLATP